MTPLQPPTHEELEAVTPVLSALLTLAKWVGGPAAVAWIIGRFLLRSGVRAGQVHAEYEELVEDVEAIKLREKSYITIPQHDAMQKICTQNLVNIIDNRTHTAMAELRAEMSTMNGNICKIMGALDIKQDNGPQHYRRRSTDLGGP